MFDNDIVAPYSLRQRFPENPPALCECNNGNNATTGIVIGRVPSLINVSFAEGGAQEGILVDGRGWIPKKQGSKVMR